MKCVNLGALTLNNHWLISGMSFQMLTTYLQLGNKNYYKGKAMYFVSFLMILKPDMNDNRTIF